MIIENGHLQWKWWCPAGQEPCRCKLFGYAAVIILSIIAGAIQCWGVNESLSFALAADTVHVILGDVAVYAVAMTGSIIALSNPAKAIHVKRVWALRNANVLTVVALMIIVGAAYRISHPVEVQTDVMRLTASIGLAINFWMYFVLKKFEIKHEHGAHDHLHDTAIRETAADTASSFLVIIVSKLMELYPLLADYRLDSLAAVFIALWLIKRAADTRAGVRKEQNEQTHSDQCASRHNN